jgi:hypothetical protein
VGNKDIVGVLVIGPIEGCIEYEGAVVSNGAAVLGIMEGRLVFGVFVGNIEGNFEGALDGITVGKLVGNEGCAEGVSVGMEGCDDGEADGMVGIVEGRRVLDGLIVGILEGAIVNTDVGVIKD